MGSGSARSDQGRHAAACRRDQRSGRVHVMGQPDVVVLRQLERDRGEGIRGTRGTVQDQLGAGFQHGMLVLQAGHRKVHRRVPRDPTSQCMPGRPEQRPSTRSAHPHDRLAHQSCLGVDQPPVHVGELPIERRGWEVRSHPVRRGSAQRSPLVRILDRWAGYTSARAAGSPGGTADRGNAVVDLLRRTPEVGGDHGLAQQRPLRHDPGEGIPDRCAQCVITSAAAIICGT